MPQIQKPTAGGDIPELPDDIYTVTCTAVEAKDIDNDAYGNGEKWQVSLELADKRDAKGNPIILDPLINRRWSEKATLFKWAVAFGAKADLSKDFDVDELVGLSARAVVKTETEGGWPRVRDMLPLGKEKLLVSFNQATDDIVAWFEQAFAIGYKRPEIYEACSKMFPGKTVPDLDAPERAKLMAALLK